jgi:hypothetical protein
MNERVSLNDLRQGVRPVDHPPVKAGRIGVLLLNLGTPEGTGYWPMRRYLKEFLSDRRVIETPRLLWWPILNLIILTKRPGPKGRDYASIWNNDRNEGPLKTITRSQAEKLASHMQGIAGDRITVDWAMRYGKPEVASASRRCSTGAATGSCWCRSTRNTRRPPPPPPATRPSARSWTCAGSPPCASRRPTTTTRSISTRWCPP